MSETIQKSGIKVFLDYTTQTYSVCSWPDERGSNIRHIKYEGDENERELLTLEFLDGRMRTFLRDLEQDRERIFINPDDTRMRLKEINPKIIEDILTQLSPEARGLLEAALESE